MRLMALTEVSVFLPCNI